MDHLLERMLLDPSVQPTNLQLLLLKTITDDFSDDAKIGSGGFAAVYKGVLQSGAVIAVKKLVNNPDMDDRKFILEVGCLMKAKHKNIVRFLGYCSDTQGKILNHEGKMIQAEERQRLLCFEFLPKGSLDNYITDVLGGLEWRTRYKIIKGICEGLHYLHQDIQVVHSDLKPANILLDDDMVPKISDFGLARFFDGKESKILATKVIGTWGYMAPELFQNRAITFKTDIYSLGIVIVEILTGQKGNYDIQNVLTNWSTRFANVPGGHPWMQHVKACIEMGIKCIDLNPEKRPTTQQIIDMLVDMEHAYGFNETDFCTSSAAHEGVLPIIPSPSPLMMDVYPLDILFPFKPKNLIKCPVTLTNRTGDLIGIWITPTSLDVCSKPGYPYVWETYEGGNDPAVSSLFRRLGPHSSETIYMTMRLQEQLPLDADKGMFDVVMVATKSEEDLKCLDRHWNNYDTWRSEDPLRGVEELGTLVHRVTLRAAVTHDPARCEGVTAHQLVQGEWSINCVDVHPTKTWLLVGNSGRDNISIWNYETQERIIRLDYLEEFLCGKRRFIRSIIAGEQWFAAGYNDGCVHVYAYTFAAKMDMVKALEAHIDKSVTCLAVQPKHTLLLTASTDDNLIKLWDWSQDWACARVIDMHTDVRDLKFSPRDTRIFASSCYGSSVIKVWDIHSSDAIATLKGTKLTFCTDGHRDFVATTTFFSNHRDNNAKIWDLQTKKHIHTLRSEIWRWDLSNLACHPTLPILAGFTERPGHRVHQIVLWDVRTYRVMKRVELRMKGYLTKMVFDSNKDITSNDCEIHSMMVLERWDVSVDLKRGLDIPDYSIRIPSVAKKNLIIHFDAVSIT